MSAFQLRVLTPAREVFVGEVEQVVAPGHNGDFGVLPGHVAYITAVRPGALHFQHGGRRHLYAVGDGFAQVSADRVSLVLSRAESVETIDEGAARQALAEAERTMLAATPGEPDYNEAQYDHTMALARLAALERKKLA